MPKLRALFELLPERLSHDAMAGVNPAPPRPMYDRAWRTHPLNANRRRCFLFSVAG